MLCPVIGKAQMTFKDSVYHSFHKVDLAGRNLEKYCEVHSTGFILECIGIVTIAGAGVAGAVADQGTSAAAIAGVGGALAFSGWIIEQVAFGRVKKAAWHLQGAGLSFTIPKKDDNPLPADQRR